MTIALKPEIARIISERVRSGRYRDAAEVLKRALALLREMDEREDRVEALLQEGLDSGPSVEMTAADWDEIRREVHRQHC